MLHRRSLALWLLVGPLAGCKGHGAPPVEPAIRQALAEQAAAWNRHDAKAWVAAFADDAEFVNILGMLLQGRPEIERRHAELFAGIFAHSSVVVTTRKVTSLGDNGAVAETDYELRGYERLPPGIRATDADGTLRTRLKYVWEQRANRWVVVSAQNTAVLPAPGAKP
jgi:uncharacterized protein (TIGR02246 family)